MTPRRQLTPRERWLYVAMALIGIGCYSIAKSIEHIDDDRPMPAAPTPPPPSRTEINDYEAIDGAREIIRDRLKAPTQAKFSDETVLAREGWRALVRLTLDAPNNFGVMIRSRYCVALLLDGEKYRWNKYAGIRECDREPSAPQIEDMEVSNLWPLAWRRANAADGGR